jgi:hypothetical protein
MKRKALPEPRHPRGKNALRGLPGMRVTRLHLFSAAPEFFYVKAACLDDPALVQATHQNWVKSVSRGP